MHCLLHLHFGGNIHLVPNKLPPALFPKMKLQFLAIAIINVSIVAAAGNITLRVQRGAYRQRVFNYIQFLAIADKYAIYELNRRHNGRGIQEWNKLLDDIVRRLIDIMKMVGSEFTLLKRDIWSDDRVGPQRGPGGFRYFKAYTNDALKVIGRDYYQKGDRYDAAYLFTGLSWEGLGKQDPAENSINRIGWGTTGAVCTAMSGGMTSIVYRGNLRSAADLASNIAKNIGRNFGLLVLQTRQEKGEACNCPIDRCIMDNYPIGDRLPQWSDCSITSFERLRADPPAICLRQPEISTSVAPGGAATAKPPKETKRPRPNASNSNAASTVTMLFLLSFCIAIATGH